MFVESLKMQANLLQASAIGMATCHAASLVETSIGVNVGLRLLRSGKHTAKRYADRGCYRNMESRRTITSECLLSSEDAANCAAPKILGEVIDFDIGMLITRTRQERFVDCYATPATSLSESSKRLLIELV